MDANQLDFTHVCLTQYIVLKIYLGSAGGGVDGLVLIWPILYR